MIKTQLDPEKEMFFAFVWLLPLVPLSAIFALCLFYGHFSWILLLITLSWFILWGCVYRNIRTEICFEGEKITILLRKRTYNVSVDDILYIDEYSFLNNPLKMHEYKIYMQPNVNIPPAYLFVRNKKIQKNLCSLFPNVPVNKNVVLE